MLLTISVKNRPAGELGYLLHKHPDKLQTVDLSIGKAHIFYPECNDEITTAAMLLDINSVDLVKKARNLSGKGFALGQYVNDRTYVASSFMSVAISKAFSTAMNGNCKEKPELVNEKMEFHAKITSLPAPKGGELLIRRLFEPLGYQLKLERYILDEKFLNWGNSKYFTLELSHSITLKALLSHLYVLIPVLDNDKHYYVSQSEIDKLLIKGEGWLEAHPEKETITKRYLLNLKSLTKIALNRLYEEEENVSENLIQNEIKESLHNIRLNTVVEKLEDSGAESIIDLGCGEGKLLKLLLKNKQFKKIAGMDVSYYELLRAKDKLYWNEMSPMQKQRIDLFQSSLTYKDDRFKNYDAATIIEVIEHMDEDRLYSLERIVFEYAKPKTVLITTPNAEYNIMYENLANGAMRHTDHRFEWTRIEFENWALSVARKYNFSVEFFPIGKEEEEIGAPSQMGVFQYGY